MLAATPSLWFHGIVEWGSPFSSERQAFKGRKKNTIEGERWSIHVDYFPKTSGPKTSLSFYLYGFLNNCLWSEWALLIQHSMPRAYLPQDLAQSRCSVSICWMNEWSNQSYSLLQENYFWGIRQEAESGEAAAHWVITVWSVPALGRPPLCCSVTHNRMHLPRHGGCSWGNRKADTKPLLIKKHLPPDGFHVYVCWEYTMNSLRIIS